MPLYEIVYAASRRHGGEILGQLAVDLVILESRLSDGSGLELLREIRRAHPTVPVMVLTGFGSESVCACAFRLGAADYFSKPVNPVALTRRIHETLSAGPRNGALSGGSFLDRPTNRDEDDRQLDSAVQYVHEHYAERLTLFDVASVAGVGYFTLSRLFSAVLGLSFRTYLLRLRIEKAGWLLAHSDRSVASIGEAVGFGDLSRFNKNFRRLTALTPTEYRRRARAKSA